MVGQHFFDHMKTESCCKNHTLLICSHLYYRKDNILNSNKVNIFNITKIKFPTQNNDKPCALVLPRVYIWSNAIEYTREYNYNNS